MGLRLSIALSLVALLALAGLQYYWIGQIAVAERQRLERGVAEASNDLAEDFSGELRQLAGIFEPRFSPAPPDPVSIATRYHYWAASAAYPGLLKSLYIVRSPTDVLRLDQVTETFVPDSWPDVLAPPTDFGTGRGFGPRGVEADLLVMPLSRRNPAGWGGGRGQAEVPQVPRERGSTPERDTNDATWLVVQLDRRVIVEQVLPRLVSRRFPDWEGRDYRVAVVETRPDMAPHAVFTSGDAWSQKDLDTPDYALDLLAPLGPPQRRGGNPGSPGVPLPPQRGGRVDRGRGPESRVTLAGQSWHLLVKHRAGSVETAVMAFRRRNLAVSFGVLVVLGVSAVSLVISSSRARRLGRLQMEFAAGISHELRTPLAVIQSAAHNLGAGVVKDREDIEEYAAIVKTEAKRLTEMVEQVMAYTETQSGRKHYELSPVDLGDITELAIRNMSMVLQEGNTIVNKSLDPALPPVLADAPALTRCLQNLLSNAIKYGQDGDIARVEIGGRHVAENGTSGKVQLIVKDHGAGVPERDVPYLFEAFHRGTNASTNTPGNGLGLHLVDRIMRAQNGSVSYERAPDGGAVFTLTLQVAETPA
jgi:signal transduction histidine kinase